jgi:light-regulated signal transduction histidine kinase (bacteriophytochrome)
MLAPARVFLRRMVLVALVFVAAAALAVRSITGRITTPLSAMTEASEAIAAGEYTRRVESRRRDEIGRLSAAFNTMAERVANAHHELEARVEQRTRELAQRAAELTAVNHELEAFSYSVSHDLRAPLRHVTGFAMLLEQHATSLTAEDRRLLAKITAAASRMGRLIDDLLAFSRVSRTPLVKSHVDLNRLVRDVEAEVMAGANGRAVTWQYDTLPAVEADPSLLRLVFVNLLSNALKYSATRERAAIEVRVDGAGSADTVVFVRDNGVGFDPQYGHKLFGVFQRLHRAEEFEGTGIGLANVRRIVQRHGGRVWADGQPDQGATFYVALPREERAA